MGFFIKILVYFNKEHAIVTISVNNLVLWQKLRTNKTKNPQNLPKDGYMNNLWQFTLLFLQFYQSFSNSYVEIVAHFFWAKFLFVIWYTFKRYWLMQNVFSFLKVLSWNLALQENFKIQVPYVFCFRELEKLCVFFSWSQI